MKLLLPLALLHIALTANSQGRFFNASFSQSQPSKEIAVLKPNYLPNYGLYSYSATYNDMFKRPEGIDYFEIVSLENYKQQKVAQIKISGYRGQAKFILDMDQAGLKTKTTTFGDITLEEQFFYNASGMNHLVVKSYIKEQQLIRVDSVLYSWQKKIINDTVYAYQVIRTNEYKTGRFLNDQNSYYNQKGYYPGMVSSPFGLNLTTTTVWTAKKKGKNIRQKTKPQKPALQPKFPSDYEADKLYFSRGYVNVDHYTFTFQGNPVNPGEKDLEMYVPELLQRSEVHHSDLACEQFEEPRFQQERWICGSGLQRMQEYEQMQRSIYYTYSQNNRGLQDTCYSNMGSDKEPIYTFSYSYYE